jgi:hypothetical protein
MLWHVSASRQRSRLKIAALPAIMRDIAHPRSYLRA